MMRTLLKSKLHRVTVTQTELHYEGSCAVDEALLEAADLVEYERVDIYNVNTGQRFSTYVVKAPRGSGTICVMGAAARLASVGDRLIVAAYATFDEDGGGRLQAARRAGGREEPHPRGEVRGRGPAAPLSPRHHRARSPPPRPLRAPERPVRFAGEFAALGTAVCWAAGSNFFAAAGQRMGSVVLNRLRITVAAGAPLHGAARPARLPLAGVGDLVAGRAARAERARGLRLRRHLLLPLARHPRPRPRGARHLDGAHLHRCCSPGRCWASGPGRSCCSAWRSRWAASPG